MAHIIRRAAQVYGTPQPSFQSHEKTGKALGGGGWGIAGQGWGSAAKTRQAGMCLSEKLGAWKKKKNPTRLSDNWTRALLTAEERGARPDGLVAGIQLWFGEMRQGPGRP